MNNRDIAAAIDRLRLVVDEATDRHEIHAEIDALERTVYAALSNTPPETKPVIPTADERWG